MPALEPVDAWRVVATSAALDTARWYGDDVDVLRIAPDEALGLRASGVEIDDPDAIVEPDAGFSMALLDGDGWSGLREHVDWAFPDEASVLVQGKVAGVPSKVRTGDPALLVVQTAYADELTRRLGW